MRPSASSASCSPAPSPMTTAARQISFGSDLRDSALPPMRLSGPAVAEVLVFKIPPAPCTHPLLLLPLHSRLPLFAPSVAIPREWHLLLDKLRRTRSYLA